MSLTSKIALASSIVITIAIVKGVHWQQERDQKFMKQGVYRDIERQMLKKKEGTEKQEQESSPSTTQIKENG